LGRRKYCARFRVNFEVLIEMMSARFIAEIVMMDMAVVDPLLHPVRVTLHGWARLTRLNGVKDVFVHGVQQTFDSVEGLPFSLAVVLSGPDACATISECPTGDT